MGEKYEGVVCTVLETLTAFSNFYGKNGELVLAGGGNTSAKDGNVLYIKGSGTSLATITPEGFVAMDRTKLAAMMEKEYPTEDAPREAAALADMMASKLPGQEEKRPSVETLLHALFPMRYVLHLHPAMVNGLTCAREGEARMHALFPDAVWVEICKPGYILAKLCKERMSDYKAAKGRDADMLFLQNHGVFLAADSDAELGKMLRHVLHTLQENCTQQADFTPAVAEDAQICAFAQTLAKLYGAGAVCLFNGCREAVRFAESRESAAPVLEPFTPDHIVYCKAHPLYLQDVETAAQAFAAYREKHGYAPKIVLVKGWGFFAVADTEKQAQTAQLLFMDAMKIAVYSRAFGGALPMTAQMTDFIVNWEVEAYRAKAAAKQG